jgi:hypothetical protein
MIGTRVIVEVGRIGGGEVFRAALFVYLHMFEIPLMLFEEKRKRFNTLLMQIGLLRPNQSTLSPCMLKKPEGNLK